MLPTRVSRYSTSPCPPRLTHTHCLSTLRPLFPLALNMIIQTRIAILPSSFDDAGPIAESRAEKHLCVREQSFSEMTTNCAPRNRVRKSVLMCCMCERSSAASISYRMYISAGFFFFFFFFLELVVYCLPAKSYKTSHSTSSCYLRSVYIGDHSKGYM